MQWKPDKERPIKPQICEQICLNIANGYFVPNGRLPSVRDMAITMGVNPNTVQVSLTMLEGQGILYSVRGSGWYVAEDISLAKATLQKMLNSKTAAYFAEMNELGMSHDETKKFVAEYSFETNSEKKE